MYEIKLPKLLYYDRTVITYFSVTNGTTGWQTVTAVAYITIPVISYD